MLKRFKRPKKSFAQTVFLVIDMEMTGLNPQADSIVSAGTVMIKQGRISLASAQHYYFLPTSRMADDVTESAHIHLITDAQREAQGESLVPWLAQLSTNLSADVWVFHHAPIDMGFLKVVSERHHISLPKVAVLDTLVREKELRRHELLDSQAQLSLNACRVRYGLPIYRQHHALSDALATPELFLAQQK